MLSSPATGLRETDLETEIKVIIVGNGQVGKTSMITRFAKGVFTDSYKKTIGTDFMEKEIFVRASGENAKLMLWDTAGQEMFSQLTKQYYKGAGAVAYVFSTTDRDSFLEVERWKNKVEDECGPIASVLVQNKIDLLDQAVVTSSEVEALARRMNCKLYRACVKDNVLIDDVFEYLAASYIQSGGKENGVSAVSSINDVSNHNIPRSTSNSSGEPQAPVVAPPVSNPTFKLEPSKKRTGGKKKMACTIL